VRGCRLAQILSPRIAMSAADPGGRCGSYQLVMGTPFTLGTMDPRLAPGDVAPPARAVADAAAPPWTIPAAAEAAAAAAAASRFFRSFSRRFRAPPPLLLSVRRYGTSSTPAKTCA
jgi:hypothetical protein